MNCDAAQRRLSGRLDSGPAAVADPDVDRHVAGCPECRTFLAVATAFDARLGRQPAVRLPAGFKAALLARLPPPRPRLSQAEIEVRRAQCDREYRAALAAPAAASLARAVHAAIHALAAGAPLRLAGRALGASALAAGLCRAWRLPGLRLVWPG